MLYTDLLQALKGEPLTTVFLADGDFNFCVRSCPPRDRTNKLLPPDRYDDVELFDKFRFRQQNISITKLKNKIRELFIFANQMAALQ